MAKKFNPKQPQRAVERPQSVDSQVSMTLEESKAFRAALHKPQPKVMKESMRREAFRVWWASYKKQYGYGTKAKTMEKALWFHLKSIGMDHPENFEKGIANFGFKKVK